jgi:glycerol uptake facilitator-like aquaporin
VVAIIFCELECCVGSCCSLNCINYSLHLPFHIAQGSGGSLIIAVVSSQFSPWASNITTLSHRTERAGILSTVTADTSEQQDLGLKTVTPQCAQIMQAVYVSFICSRVLPFGLFRAEDSRNSRAVPCDRLQAWCLCEATVSGISFRGYYLLSCRCPLYC